MNGAPEIGAVAALLEAGRYAEAEAGARKLVEDGPQHGMGWKALSAVLAAQARWREALPAIQRTLEILPSDPDALNALGLALDALGRPSEAEAAYRRALEHLPDSPLVHNNLGNALTRLGRLPEAEASYRRALAQEPDLREAHSNLCNVLHALGRYAEAEAQGRRAVERAPDFHPAHNNLGVTLLALGRFAEAEATCRRAAELRPDYPDAWNNLGRVCQALGRTQEAEAHFRRAVELHPGYGEAFGNLGNALHTLGRLAEAEAAHRRALELHPDSPTAHVQLGLALQALGRPAEAAVSYRRALAAGSHRSAEYAQLVQAMNGLSHVLGRMVPEWHLPMMNDTARNQAYLAALQSAVTPATRVLEIGTGSGLLAMMAARAGAKEVWTCEAEPLIAETARQIVADNGLGAAVHVIAKKSTEVAIGADLPARADLLVSEIFSSELLGEGVLPSIEDAKRRLLAPGARIIPAAGSVMCALFGGEGIRENIQVGQVCGFDLSRFNAIASQKRFLHRGDLGLELLTEPAEAFAFDFMAQDYFPAERRTLRLPVRVAGRCDGVVQWIRLRMRDDIVFENTPSSRNRASGWQQCLYRFADPIELRPGQTVVLCAAHNRSSVWFFLEGLEPPASHDGAAILTT